MITSVIEAKDVYFIYPDGTQALGGVNFCVKKGEFVGILGANGAGKTTLLKILNGLLKPTRGDVYIEGENLKSISQDKLFTKACTVFQDPDCQLFSPTVGEDVAFGPANMGLSKEEVKIRVYNSLAAVGMFEFAEKAIHNLSYGQKKRVCLAGVLAIGPQIIFLDEPTGSLDPMGTGSIMRLLKGLNKKGVTMVIATHSVDLIPLFVNRVAVMGNGKIIKEGSPLDVFSDIAMIRENKLRLPRVAHLMEILKKKDELPMENLPLTIGEARKKILELISVKERV
ncbi:MAG: ATP-binding cassette domain-containing protein [Candidatus Omnitrophica bacterium]|nr:ATP-binding cassette domain-containing protein [Candidatus Omnitrophota bacterium]